MKKIEIINAEVSRETGSTIISGKIINIAYGSNMDLEQMSLRCPEAEIIGKGYIKDYRLMFKGSKTGSYATIEPAAGYKVPVVLWAVSAQDERYLDRYEGFPTFYYKQDLQVHLTNILKTPTKVTGMAYIMDETRKCGVPSAAYFNLLATAYKRFGFDTSILAEALAYSNKMRGQA